MSTTSTRPKPSMPVSWGSTSSRGAIRATSFACGPTVVLAFVAEETVVPPGDDQLPVPPHGATGPGHICFSVPGEELDGWAAYLVDKG